MGNYPQQDVWHSLFLQVWDRCLWACSDSEAPRFAALKAIRQSLMVILVRSSRLSKHSSLHGMFPAWCLHSDQCLWSWWTSNLSYWACEGSCIRLQAMRWALSEWQSNWHQVCEVPNSCWDWASARWHGWHPWGQAPWCDLHHTHIVDHLQSSRCQV